MIWTTTDDSGQPIAVLGVKGKYGGQVHSIYQKVSIDSHWLGDPTIAFKTMATIAERPADFSKFSSETIHPKFSGWKISNIKYALVDSKGRLAKDSKGKVINPLHSESLIECAMPSPPDGDMITYSNNNGAYSGVIGLRLMGKLKVDYKELYTVGDRNHDIVGSITISNTGIQESKIDIWSIMLNGDSKPDITLVGGKSLTYNYRIPCRDASYEGNFAFEFMYRDYSTATQSDTSFGNIPGSYRKQYSVNKFKYLCQKLSYQNFNASLPSINSIINANGQTTLDLTVSSLDGSPLTNGHFLINQNTALAAANLKAQNIVVTPTFTPNDQDFTPPGNVTTMTIPVTVTAPCGPTPGPQTDFQAKVTDSTGNTQEATFPVSLTCLGPILSDPTPNPLTISANVGQTASGSFSFSNDAQADDQGRKAPLHYTITSTSGLNLSTSSGTLSGGASQSVTVSKMCSEGGVLNYTANILSSDEGVGSKSIDITVICKEPTSIDIGRYINGECRYFSVDNIKSGASVEMCAHVGDDPDQEVTWSATGGGSVTPGGKNADYAFATLSVPSHNDNFWIDVTATSTKKPSLQDTMQVHPMEITLLLGSTSSNPGCWYPELSYLANETKSLCIHIANDAKNMGVNLTATAGSVTGFAPVVDDVEYRGATFTAPDMPLCNWPNSVPPLTIYITATSVADPTISTQLRVYVGCKNQ